MRTRAMGAVLVRHAEQLKAVFAAYAAADQTSADARRSLRTMNVLECHALCEDCGLFDAKFSVRDLLISFVRVNLSDDLYYQPEVEDDDVAQRSTSSELDYGEVRRKGTPRTVARARLEQWLCVR
jgi:hypothetical protein